MLNFDVSSLRIDRIRFERGIDRPGIVLRRETQTREKPAQTPRPERARVRKAVTPVRAEG